MHLPAALRIDSNLPATPVNGNQPTGPSSGRGDKDGAAFSAELNGELKARQHNVSRDDRYQDDRHQDGMDQDRGQQEKADQANTQDKLDQDKTHQGRLRHDKAQRSRDSSGDSSRDSSRDSSSGVASSTADGNSGRELPNRGGELPPAGDSGTSLAVKHSEHSAVDAVSEATAKNTTPPPEDSLPGTEAGAVVAGQFSALVATITGLNTAQSGGVSKDSARTGSKPAHNSQRIPLSGRAASPVLMPALEKAAFINSANHEGIRAHLEAVATGRAETSLAGLNTVAQDVATPASHSFSGQAGQLLQAEGGKPLTESLLPSRPTFTLQTQAGLPGWDAELGDRVRWLLGRGHPLAELRLNPAQLGAVEVRIVNDGDRTNVTFFAAHPHARELLDLALPRLQQMFQQHGLDLAGANVSVYPDGQAQDAGDGRQAGSGSSPATSDPFASEAGVDERQWLIEQGYINSLGAIDYYV